MLQKQATKTDCQTLALPASREDLGFELHLSEADAQTVMMGLLPRDMDDKWFIYFEEEWLYFHRSWTGACIYALRLTKSLDGFQVAESWVSRELTQYKETRTDYDRELLRFMIQALLLKQPAEFPRPPEAALYPKGAYQHSVVGKGYPERNATETPKQSFWQRLWSKLGFGRTVQK